MYNRPFKPGDLVRQPNRFELFFVLEVLQSPSDYWNFEFEEENFDFVRVSSTRDGKVQVFFSNNFELVSSGK